MICRAEQLAIIMVSSKCQTIVIPFEYYDQVENYLRTEQIDIINKELFDFPGSEEFFSWMKENSESLRLKMNHSHHIITPKNSYAAPMQLNLELTTRCPLHCPQCYCNLNRGKDLSLDRAKDVLRQAAELGVAYINLSGGETMVYPHLYELLRECSSLGMYAAVALSGYGIDKDSLNKLIDNGAHEIYVSLNGSTEEISSITRDGYHLAINALELLSEIGFENTAVNWVAHQSNIEDFANVAMLCARLHVKKLIVMVFKPDASHSLESAPDGEQLLKLVQDIKQLRSTLPSLCIEVESCYSPLRALLGQKFLLNSNVGISKGCGAGREGASLDVDGNFTPCRHLDFPEYFDSLKDYWYKSELLQKLRFVETTPEEPCANCRYSPYCLSCLAVNAKLHNRIVKANKYCSLWK